MRTRSLVLALAASVALLAPGARASEDNPLMPKRVFKTAIVTYTVSGQFQKGTETRYIDGERMRTEQRFTQSGPVPGGKSKIELVLPDYIYRWDVGATAGQKTKNPQKAVLAKYNALSGPEKEKFRKNAENFADQLQAGLMAQPGMEAKRTTRKILGRECEQLEVAMVKTCLWKAGGNLPLKIDRGALYSSEATGLDLDKKIPEEKFAVPVGVTFTARPEDDQMVERMADMMFNMIQSGEAPKMPALPPEMLKKMQKAPPPKAGAPNP
ncbi:MAG: hypothetical protein K8I02_00815 [Candidatus Methylomirabilis sp.]|nr:hypothetical protein [Deltaproteobacteria bacterium]